MEVIVTIVVLTEIEARVVEEFGIVAVRRIGSGFIEIRAVRSGNRGNGINPDDTENRRPDGKTDFHDLDIDLGEEVIKAPQPEQKRDKQRGEEQIEQDIVSLKNHDLACNIRLVKHAGLEKAHDADIAERQKNKETENIDNDELNPVGFLNRLNGSRLLFRRGSFLFVFTHLFF